MAAKATKAAAPKKATIAKKTTKVKAAPKGLQLSAAQWKAYNAAFSATAQKLSNAAALRARATGYRKYQLQAAASTVRQYGVARANAQAAAVAAYATRRSWATSHLAHQNSALQNRIEQDMYTHANLAGRLQYAQAGVKAYMDQAVMRTVTQGQALSYEAKFFNTVNKTAKKAAKSTLPKAKGTPLSKSIARAATKAGLQAAAKVRVPKGASAGATTAKAKRANIKTNRAAAAASKKAAPKAAKTRTAPLNLAGMAAAYASAQYTGAYSGEAPPVNRTGLSTEWHGDEITPNCIVVAVANDLLWAKQVKVYDSDLKELAAEVGDEPTIEEVLWHIWLTGWPASHRARLVNYSEVPDDHLERDGLVIGYEALTANGWKDHCALSRTQNRVISWGKERDRESLVEEAWELTWQL